MHRLTGTKITDESEHIQQSILDILLTAKGSRIMRRDYGSNLYKLLDRPISSALLLQISAACVMALKVWEPRIQVTSFKVTMPIDTKGKLVATLVSTIKKSNTPLKMTDIPLTLT